MLRFELTGEIDIAINAIPGFDGKELVLTDKASKAQLAVKLPGSAPRKLAGALLGGIELPNGARTLQERETLGR